MKNILCSVYRLQPGDTWDEHDGYTYVIYSVKPESATTMEVLVIQTKDCKHKPMTMIMGNVQTMVVDRPEVKA